MMQQPLTGVTWDALDSSVSITTVAQIKGPSMGNVIEALDQIIGELQAMEPEDEIAISNDTPKQSKSPMEKIIKGYLQHLHPYIAKGCSQLFIDKHYPQAIEESAKAVFQYLREKTGLKDDGTNLAEKTFSLKSPVLAFSDLSDQTKKDEQLGFMEILKGFTKGVRNPFAHTHGKQEEQQKAFEYLVMASLLCRRIDDSSPEEINI